MDPFKLFGKILVASFKITGYFVVSVVQTIWYLAHLQPEKVGDVIGYFGRSTVDAIAELFR
jgi:hypothetical protein